MTAVAALTILRIVLYGAASCIVLFERRWWEWLALLGLLTSNYIARFTGLGLVEVELFRTVVSGVLVYSILRRK